MRHAIFDFRVLLLAFAIALPACSDRTSGSDAIAEKAPEARPEARKAPALAAVPESVPEPVAVCADCGVVTQIQSYQVEGKGSGVGAVAGAVVGGLLGNQVGGGTGKKIATVAGAAGGAYAGHEIEKRQRASTAYHVDVRMDNGDTVRLDYANPPDLAVGQKVRVSGGVALPQ